MADDRVKAEHLVAVTWPEDTGAPLIQGNGWVVHATQAAAILPLQQQQAPPPTATSRAAKEGER